MNKKRRVIALIDGYNMYHGLDDTGRNHLKWLDLHKLMTNFLKSDQQLDGVFYFTAYADHRSKSSVDRHRIYIQALRAQGVSVELGKFKKRQKKCRNCGEEFSTHEEKETDVNIATMMIDAAHENLFDDLFLVSGDTDFKQPIDLIMKRFPDKQIHIFLPPKRRNFEMLQMGNRAVILEKKHIKKALLPSVVPLPNGKNIHRPPKYNPPTK